MLANLFVAASNNSLVGVMSFSTAPLMYNEFVLEKVEYRILFNQH